MVSVFAKITAEDGVTVRYYKLFVTRAGSSMDASLYSICGRTVTDDPVHTGTSSSDAKEISITVASKYDTIRASDIVASDMAIAQVSFYGQDYTYTNENTLGVSLPERSGALVYAKVTAEDGVTVRYYKLFVTRAGSSMDASLYSICGRTVTDDALHTGTSSSDAKEINVVVASKYDTIKASDIVASDMAIAQVNFYGRDYTYTNENATGVSLPERSGELVYAKVTAEDGVTVRYYKLFVTRAGSSMDASLYSVCGRTVTDDPAHTGTSSSDAKEISVTVASKYDTIKASDIVASDMAIAQVNFYGQDYTYTNESNSGVSLPEGSAALVFVKVTAEDGVTARYYKISVTREKSGGQDISYGGAGGATSAPSMNTGVNTIANTATPVTVLTKDAVTSATFMLEEKPIATISEDLAQKLINAAKSTESDGKNSVVRVGLKTSRETDSFNVTFPGNSLKKLANETNSALELESDIGQIKYNSKAVESISQSAGTNSISFTMQTADVSAIAGDARKLIGSRPVYQLSVMAGNNKISSFGEGSAEISIPYELKPDEDKNAIVVYYISDSGSIKTVLGAYNPETKKVNFIVSHFSKYAIGYNKVTFNDVGKDKWYSNAVSFVAARGIAAGTSEAAYSPDKTLSRGEFIVMLMRAYNIEPSKNQNDNFEDAGDTYYTEYLAKAKELGISAGAGKNVFEPGVQISRQDMLLLLYRVLNKLDRLPASTNTERTALSFKDADEVSGYAKDALNDFIKSGVVSGTDGYLKPKDNLTRAEMAQILYNLLSK
jgi:hypothetical protein